MTEQIRLLSHKGVCHTIRSHVRLSRHMRIAQATILSHNEQSWKFVLAAVAMQDHNMILNCKQQFSNLRAFCISEWRMRFSLNATFLWAIQAVVVRWEDKTGNFGGQSAELGKVTKWQEPA